MKLATFTHAGSTRIGVVTGDSVVDLSAAAPDLPTEMVAFLEAGDAALDAARAAASKSDSTLSLADVHLELSLIHI